MSRNTIAMFADFKTLRKAYIEIQNFLENETGVHVQSLETKIEENLGCAGDDNYDLLLKFITRYKPDTTGFDYSKHFLSEAELFGSSAVLFAILCTPIQMLAWLISLLTGCKINLTPLKLFPKPDQEKLDMSFGDMLTWYLTGKYCLRSDVQFRLKAA